MAADQRGLILFVRRSSAASVQLGIGVTSSGGETEKQIRVALHPLFRLEIRWK
jgi:hypothetical protein